MNRQAEPTITDRQQLEFLTEAATEYAITTLDQAGHITSWNSGAQRIMGYEAGEIIGQHVGVLFSAEDHAAGRPESTLLAAVASGRFQDEGWGVRKDGSRFWASTLLRVVRAADGRVQGFARITRDISRRPRTEDRLRQIVDSAPSAIVMVNDAGLIEMVNAQTERLFGYARQELLGQPVELLMPGQFRPGHPHLRGGFFADPRSRPMGAGRDLFALRKDGSEFPVEIGLNPIETEDGTMVLSAIVDISDRKHLRYAHNSLAQQISP